jgi:hypothetical protein
MVVGTLDKLALVQELAYDPSRDNGRKIILISWHNKIQTRKYRNFATYRYGKYIAMEVLSL